MTTDSGVPDEGLPDAPGGDGPAATAGGGGLPAWAWILIVLAIIAIIVGLVLIFTAGDDDEEAADTTAAPTTTAAATTTSAAPTTTVAPTTTGAPETTVAPTTTVASTTTAAPETTLAPTTTAAAGGVVVPPTAVSALLGTDVPPYGSVELFPPGSVAADWYQWEGFYVVLYRGLQVTQPLCPGNSIETAGGFENITNSELGGAGGCEGAASLAGPDFGARQCGDLSFYLTEIPIESEGTLFGTVELFESADAISGATSTVAADLANTPEFDPNASSYELPPSDLDDLTTVTC